jgi:glutamine amidotransferase-like uncharacterized protein
MVKTRACHARDEGIVTPTGRHLLNTVVISQWCLMKTIALFMNHPECSRQCVSGMIEALRHKYKIRIVSNEFFTKENLKDVDIVAFPGGIGDADSYYDFFKRRHGNAVAEFVDNGGHYLGICMGAYWAGPDFFDILDNVVPVQYIKRPKADVRRPYGTIANVQWLGQYEPMFFYDGCALIGDENKCNVIARYDNDDPMAIIQGRVGIIGCHPEAEKFWFDQYKYIKDFWHEHRHHQLLVDFVDRLVSN